MRLRNRLWLRVMQKQPLNLCLPRMFQPRGNFFFFPVRNKLGRGGLEAPDLTAWRKTCT